jgi:hypothetical protein
MHSGGNLFRYWGLLIPDKSRNYSTFDMRNYYGLPFVPFADALAGDGHLRPRLIYLV